MTDGTLLRAEFHVYRTLAGFGIEHAAKYLALNSGLKGYVFVEEDGSLTGTVEGLATSVANFGLWLSDAGPPGTNIAAIEFTSIRLSGPDQLMFTRFRIL